MSDYFNKSVLVFTLLSFFHNSFSQGPSVTYSLKTDLKVQERLIFDYTQNRRPHPDFINPITGGPDFKVECEPKTTNDSSSFVCKDSLIVKCYASDSIEIIYKKGYFRKKKKTYDGGFSYMIGLISGSLYLYEFECCTFLWKFLGECLPVRRSDRRTNNRRIANNNGNPFYDYIKEHANEDFVISSPFPNPANNNLNWEIFINHPSSLNVSLYDLLGKKVHDENMFLSEGLHIVPINVSQLKGGNYTYRVFDGKTIKRGHIVVNH